MHLFHLQNHIVSYDWFSLRVCSVIFGIDVCSNFFIYYPPSRLGLSLRAGDRGFPPATQSMAYGYFRP